MNDTVNHPEHYTSDPSGVECIEIIRHRNFNIGSAVKYLWRAGLKDEDTYVEDLEKAVWYIQDEINRLATIECDTSDFNDDLEKSVIYNGKAYFQEGVCQVEDVSIFFKPDETTVETSKGDMD